jgi:hypothetical protein
VVPVVEAEAHRAPVESRGVADQLRSVRSYPSLDWPREVRGWRRCKFWAHLCVRLRHLSLAYCACLGPIAHVWALIAGVAGSAYATHRAKMMFDAVVEKAEIQLNGLIQDGGAAARRVVQTIGGICTAFVWIVALLCALRIGAFIWTSDG